MSRRSHGERRSRRRCGRGVGLSCVRCRDYYLLATLRRLGRMFCRCGELGKMFWTLGGTTTLYFLRELVPRGTCGRAGVLPKVPDLRYLPTVDPRDMRQVHVHTPAAITPCHHHTPTCHAVVYDQLPMSLVRRHLRDRRPDSLPVFTPCR